MPYTNLTHKCYIGRYGLKIWTIWKTMSHIPSLARAHTHRESRLWTDEKSIVAEVIRLIIRALDWESTVTTGHWTVPLSHVCREEQWRQPETVSRQIDQIIGLLLAEYLLLANLPGDRSYIFTMVTSFVQIFGDLTHVCIAKRNRLPHVFCFHNNHPITLNCDHIRTENPVRSTKTYLLLDTSSLWPDKVGNVMLYSVMR